MGILSDAFAAIKQRGAEVLDPEAIERACRDAGLEWRCRLLTPVVTVQAFFLQVLHGNTACGHVPRLMGVRFTAGAYCRARKRVALEVFRRLLEGFVDRLHEGALGEGRWLGHRLFLVDGSTFSMPDTPELQARFGQHTSQKPGVGFPLAHALLLTHASTGFITRVLAGPWRTHDQSRMPELHPELAAGDVLVGDRAFCSFAHLALLSQRGIDAVLRVHQRTIVDFTPGREHIDPRRRGERPRKKGLPRSRWIKRLGDEDQLVEWLKVDRAGPWVSQEAYDAAPDKLLVRELRYRVTRRGFRSKRVTLVTTLTDPRRYTKEELAGVYFKRWRIETDLRHLKQTMGMNVLKCKSAGGVLKELAVFAIVYNLVRLAMLDAAGRQHVDPYRLSFIDALRWLQTARPGDPPPVLIVNPDRTGRVEPRCIKRNTHKYPWMTKPRAVMRKNLNA